MWRAPEPPLPRAPFRALAAATKLQKNKSPNGQGRGGDLGNPSLPEPTRPRRSALALELVWAVSKAEQGSGAA